MEEITLDVSALEPPQPMTEILLAMAQLQKQQYLIVIHRREPFPLFEKLETAGWLYVCMSISVECFHIYIYKQTDQIEFDSIFTR